MTGYIVALVIGFFIGDWFHMRLKPSVRRLRRAFTHKKSTRKTRH